MFDTFLFGIFPYAAFITAIIGLIWRYRTNQFSYSTVSSQFLENKQLFWGSTPWHYGIILILLAHVTAATLPSLIQSINAYPIRIYIVEGTSLALSLMLLVGLTVLVVRRIITPNVRVTTSAMDWVLLTVLVVQVVSGISTAVLYRWGSSWFLQTGAPYLRSLFTLSPRIEYVTALPLLSKLHTINAFVLLGLFPFSRLVHILSVPLAYLWRPYQIVMWYRRQAQQ
jgi:nitrate reductase gamma subunit